MPTTWESMHGTNARVIEQSHIAAEEGSLVFDHRPEQVLAGVEETVPACGGHCFEKSRYLPIMSRDGLRRLKAILKRLPFYRGRNHQQSRGDDDEFHHWSDQQVRAAGGQRIIRTTHATLGAGFTGSVVQPYGLTPKIHLRLSASKNCKGIRPLISGSIHPRSSPCFLWDTSIGCGYLGNEG